MEALNVVGKSLPRVDGIEKVTGKATFTTDLELPRMLWGKILRSPYAHARILRVDTSKAEALSGVVAVATGADVKARHGAGINDQYFLAKDKVRYIGDPVAAVAAENEDIAEEALELVEVEYEELPAVFDAEEALRPDPPAILHEELSTYKRTHVVPARTDVEMPNLCNYFRVRRGDLEQGFREADEVVEEEFTSAMIAHCAMEPHNAVAQVDIEGNITVWTSNQTPFMVRDQLCDAFGIPPSKVRIIIPRHVGGGYGGKCEMKAEPIAVALAMKSARPVKVVLTREEEFIGTDVRHPSESYIKLGATREGKLTALEVKIILNGGAYSETGYLVIRNGCFAICGTYKVPTLKLDSYGAYTNQPISSAFRGFGNAQAMWPLESAMDIMARRLGLDPLEFRLKNAYQEGDENVLGEEMHSVGTAECLEKVAAAIELGKPSTPGAGPWRRGKGIACGNKYSLAPTAASAIVKVHDDESIEVRTSAIDLGQGAHTVWSQVAAEEFGIPMEKVKDKVKIVSTDTAITPADHGAISSRQTYNTGNAIRLACQDAREQVFQKVAERLEASPEDLAIKDGRVFVRGAPERSLRVGELFTPMIYAGVFLEEGGEFLGKATWYQRADILDRDTGQIVEKKLGRTTAFYIHSAQGAEVEVNVETGRVRVLRFVSAIDIGKAINPLNAMAQIEGGALSMGIGSVLFEEMVLERGQVLNPNFIGYKIPTATEMPELGGTHALIVEAPHRDGPYGAKGLGECVLIATAPAIANAIYDATGVRLKDLPITRERVLCALGGKSES